MRPAVRWVC